MPPVANTRCTADCSSSGCKPDRKYVDSDTVPVATTHRRRGSTIRCADLRPAKPAVRYVRGEVGDPYRIRGAVEEHYHARYHAYLQLKAQAKRAAIPRITVEESK